MFEFELTPLELVTPWGESPNLSLHWFGLTYGKYRIRVGKDYLLNYSAGYSTHTGDATSFVEYQVVRLWEDILEMLPSILEPAPDELHYLLESSATERKNFLGRAIDEDLPESSTYWLCDRELDCGYLATAPQISIWSTESDVTISWDCERNTENSKPVWSASRGSYKMTRTEFLNAVTEFDAALIAQMKDRVDSVLSGWKSGTVRIDLGHLVREQEDRSTWLANHLQRAINTPWDEIIRHITKK